jgi:SAM-dependent methyltransferase
MHAIENRDPERERWEAALRAHAGETPGYDGWLDKYFEGDRGAAHTVVELGCGTGADTSFLANTGCTLICCDFAEEALRHVAARHPRIATKAFNLKDRFPFESGVADTAVASLCLHFFDEAALAGILAEIKRILKDDGRLLCRLNSVNDYIKGMPCETELAPGAYMTPNGFKRFYDEDAVRAAFRDWKLAYIAEKTTVKFSKPKSLWELVLTKTQGGNS